MLSIFTAAFLYLIAFLPSFDVVCSRRIFRICVARGVRIAENFSLRDLVRFCESLEGFDGVFCGGEASESLMSCVWYCSAWFGAGSSGETDDGVAVYSRRCAPSFSYFR